MKIELTRKEVIRLISWLEWAEKEEEVATEEDIKIKKKLEKQCPELWEKS